MTDSDYLTPDERQQQVEAWDEGRLRGDVVLFGVLDSHAVADELLREARAALVCYCDTDAPCEWDMCACQEVPCLHCRTARRIDAVLNPEKDA